MDTLGKILKIHSDIFDPHKIIVEVIKLNNRLIDILLLVLIELIVAYIFLFFGRINYAIICIIILVITAEVGSRWHKSKLDETYGIENLDKNRIETLSDKILKSLNIDIKVEDENKLIESLIKDRINSINKKNQSKGNIYLAMLTIILPVIFSYLMENVDGVFAIAFFIILFGFFLLVKSLVSTFKEYSSISKLEHLKQILKEIQLQNLKSKRQFISTDIEGKVNIETAARNNEQKSNVNNDKVKIVKTSKEDYTTSLKTDKHQS